MPSSGDNDDAIVDYYETCAGYSPTGCKKSTNPEQTKKATYNMCSRFAHNVHTATSSPTGSNYYVVTPAFAAKYNG